MNSKEEYKYSNWMVTIGPWYEDGVPTKKLDKDLLIASLDKGCRDWCFQVETYENTDHKSEHYQITLRWNIRVRHTTLLNYLQAELEWQRSSIHLERTIGTWEQSIDYCTKLDTRVDGPYYSKTLKPLYSYNQKDIDFLNEKDKRYPWQEDLLDEIFDVFPSMFKDPDDRSIYWITDRKGNSGKSKFVKFICVNNDNATKISFGNTNQLRSSVISGGPKVCYFIDMPRTRGEDEYISSLLSAIEDIKNGFVTSSMYGNNSQLVMNPPHIVIFSNESCPKEALSSDRWIVYEIRDTKLIYSFLNSDYIDKGYHPHREGEFL
jgi:hypothetical protein